MKIRLTFASILVTWKIFIIVIVIISEKYQKLENEKKNTRTVRKTNVGPIVRYQSMSMPVLMLSDIQGGKDEEKINVEGDDDKNGTASVATTNENGDTVLLAVKQ